MSYSILIIFVYLSFFDNSMCIYIYYNVYYNIYYTMIYHIHIYYGRVFYMYNFVYIYYNVYSILIIFVDLSICFFYLCLSFITIGMFSYCFYCCYYC